YDEIRGTGDLKEIVVREVNGNLIIAVVTPNNKPLKEQEKLVSILKKHLNNEFSLYQNINTLKNNVVLGDEFRYICGRTDYASTMLGIKYKVGVRSFTQVNTCVCEKLYGAVKSEIGKDEELTVIDAYSGAGLMTVILSKDVKKAIGIEIVPEAVEIANDLAKENGLCDKISNYLGKCEDIMPDIINEISGRFAIVLDPPRKGCDINVINAVKISGAEKIVYVSCMPSTLARDVGLITGSLVYDGKNLVFGNGDGNYKIEKVIPFDMFPNTKHVETVCVLARTK
ncbi:MAG: class I SAM-dependent RNA methyltransferase, partial [Clostridia bacterium]|nr:class I SAM-dependent RNA methyltransferase [Clostridia bacterium]